MWQRNLLTERLSLEWPIIQAPMAGSTTPELAVAVCEAGGLGSLGCALLTAEQYREQVIAVRAATSRSFNVNFFAYPDPRIDPDQAGPMRERLQPYYDARGLGPVPEAEVPARPFGRVLLEAVLATRPPIVSFHFGLPESDVVAAIKATGALIASSATTVAEARWLEAHGADVVIAQGIEAGGHRGTFLGTDTTQQSGTVALVPQVVDAVSIPVIAAGASRMVAVSPPRCSWAHPLFSWGRPFSFVPRRLFTPRIAPPSPAQPTRLRGSPSSSAAVRRAAWSTGSWKSSAMSRTPWRPFRLSSG